MSHQWIAPSAGILIFVTLIVLSSLNLWSHSPVGAGVVGGLSWVVASWLVRRFDTRHAR